MFEILFNGMAAFQQSGILVAALFLLAIGGVLLGNEINWRCRGLRVAGNVIGVRQKGKCYYPVYRYMLPTGETFESTSDTGSSLTRGKETGRAVPLMVFPEDPLKVSPADSYASGIAGLLFLAPGVGLVYLAFATYPATVWTWAMLAAFFLYGALRFRKYIIPKEQRLSPADWKASRKAQRRKEMEAFPVRGIEDILASPEMVAVREQQAKSNRVAAPILLLFALGLMYGAYFQYGEMSQLEKQGVRAVGEVVRLQEQHSSGHNGGYVYYPVIIFADQQGNSITFKDRAGSNPPLYKTGEKVEVVYLAGQAEKSARIDHGAWNWLPVGGCLALSFLFLFVVFRMRA